MPNGCMQEWGHHILGWILPLGNYHRLRLSTIPRLNLSTLRPDGAASSAVETSYTGLASSTREPTPAPAVYDTLNKSVYANVHSAAPGMM